MPRNRSGASKAPKLSKSKPVKNAPAPVRHAPPPAPVQGSGGSAMGGVANTIAEGLAFGSGSAIAHRAADAFMGPRVVTYEAAPATEAAAPALVCGNHMKALHDCLGSNLSNPESAGSCKFYVDMLNECRKHAAATM